MKKILIMIAIFQFLSLMTWAQNVLDQDRVLYPSPTASSLGKYGEYPVSLYNGLVNINQEICTIESGQLSLDVSLSYHSGGNKPSDIPGWVGLGFSLNAGGVITRVVKGIPDDVLGGYYFSRNEIKTMLSADLKPDFNFIANYIDRGIDTKSDIYQFNFNGKIGQFVFDLDGNVRFLKNEPYKIEFDYGVGGTYNFDSFRITTEDGVVYTFSGKEKSSFQARLGDPFYNSSWYLTKMENLKGDSIILKYTESGINRRYKNYVSEKYIIGMANMFGINEQTRTLSGNTDIVIYLDEIIFNGGKLSFLKSYRGDVAYAPEGASSYAIERKLDEITLSDHNNNQIKKWQFNYVEDIGRLKLKTMTVLGANIVADQIYKFEYNDLLLPVGSPYPFISNSIDYWGYYNKQVNSSGKMPVVFSQYLNKKIGSADRDCNDEGMKAEILEKIIFPTGGYSQFEFESNDYGAQGESFAENPMVNYLWDSLDFSYEDGYFDQDPYSMSFTLLSPKDVKIARSIKPQGPNRAWLWGTNYEVVDVVLPAGTYNLGEMFSANTLTTEANSDIHFARGAVIWGNEVPTRAKKGPGLRIKSITNFDGKNTTKKKFKYRGDDPTISTGVLSVFPACYVPLDKFHWNSWGDMLSSDPINDLPSDAPIGYSEVTEIFPDLSEITHKYTTYLDNPDRDGWFHDGDSDQKLSPLISTSFMRGLETNTSMYSKDGLIVRSIANEYTILHEVSQDIPALNLTSTFTPIREGNMVVQTGLFSSFFTIPKRFVYKSKEEEVNFGKDGTHPVTKETKYYYDNPGHLQITRKEIIGSNGIKTSQSTSYPTDYQNGVGFIDLLKQNHIWNLPVELVQYKGSGNSIIVTAGKINIYNEDGKGLKKEELLLENTAPIPLSSFKFSNRNIGDLPFGSPAVSFLKDSRYQLRVGYRHDSKGNIIEIVPIGGAPTSYLWSFNKKYPIAELKNTSYSAIENAIGSGSIEAFSGTYPDKLSIDNFLSNIKLNLPNTSISAYSYRPLVGLQSTTDFKGMTTYYEYDPFGRLKSVKDQNMNITKSYDYHFKP